MTEQNAGQDPQQAYAPILQPLPDVAYLEKTVIEEPEPRTGRGLTIAVSAAAVLMVAGLSWAAYDKWSDDDSRQSAPSAVEQWPDQANDECYSPVVEKTYPGDKTVTSDDPQDWKKGVLVTVKPPTDPTYKGTYIGFHAPEETVDATTWSQMIDPADIAARAMLMRSGEGSYTIVVQNVGTDGSAVCDVKPQAAFKQASVQKALKDGVIEPDF